MKTWVGWRQTELRIEKLGKKKAKEEDSAIEEKPAETKEATTNGEGKTDEADTDADKKEKKVTFVNS